MPRATVTPNINPNPKVNQNQEKGTKGEITVGRKLQTPNTKETKPDPKASSSQEEEKKQNKRKKTQAKQQEIHPPKKQNQSNKPTPMHTDTNAIKTSNKYSELEEMETENPRPIIQAQNPPPINQTQNTPLRSGMIQLKNIK